jgi:hypothetical protein
MDSETIKHIRETGEATKNQDYVIELFEEGRNILIAEIDPLITKLKRVNKEYCIDLLESHIEFLNDSLALATNYLTKNSKCPITAEQGALIANLNSTVRDIEKEMVKITEK